MDLSVTALCAQNFGGSDCTQCVTGHNCDAEVDDCVGVTCNGNGQCVDDVDSFSCTCDPGFTGDRCQINIYSGDSEGSEFISTGIYRARNVQSY